MFPQFTVFGRHFGSYAVLSAIGALLCGFLFFWMIKRRGLNDNHAIAFFLWLVPGAFLGAHLLYGITQVKNWHLLWQASSAREFFSAFMTVFGGMVFYGGLIGGIVTALIVIHAMKLPLAVYADCMAPILPLFHGIARVGCFLGGCCYGIESSFGFAARENPFAPEVVGVTRFPVQLLESGCNLLLAGALFLLLQKEKTHPALRGKLFPIYLLSYAVIRFGDEFLRGDAIRGFWGPLSTSQWISLGIFVASLTVLLFLRGKLPPEQPRDLALRAPIQKEAQAG